MKKVIFTVGHSTKPIDIFIEMLQSFKVNAVVDIRSVPRSLTNPQYNLDILPELLAEFGIKHYQITNLGGFRKKSKTVSKDTNAFWDNRSFHNYADYALSDDFAEGLHELLKISDNVRCAIMCSEAVWWRCHRRIVADYLLIRKVEVIHIMDVGKSSKALLNSSAEIYGVKIFYPRTE